MYFAPGATHAPHHVPQEWSDKYRGKFDEGWDVLREKIFARQKKLGVIPPDAELTQRHDEIPAWDDMPDELKPVLARQMEIYAGFLEQTDHEVGRVIDAIDDLGVLDDTLIYYIIGDNGASAEGTPNGCFNEMTTLNGMAGHRDHRVPAVQDRRLRHPGRLQPLRGGLGARAVHALPVDQAGGLALGRHPQRHHRALAQRAVRQGRHPQPVPPRHRRRPDDPGGGRYPGALQSSTEFSRHRSRASACWPRCATPTRPRPTIVQYFEIMGNRGIYHNGWTACTKHRTPWKADTPPPFDDDIWELYGPDDWTQAHNLAAENPEKLAELQRLWLIEAVKYNVVPLDDRAFERINPDIAGRPQLIRGNSQLLFSGMRVSESCVVNIKNKSHSVTANIVVPDGGATGVIVTQGGQVGGWSLYVHDGRLKYCYNFFGIQHFIVAADDPLPAGKHQVRMEFAYDGGGLAKGGNVTLYYDGKAVGTGRVEHHHSDGLLRRRGLRRRLRTPARRHHRTTAPSGNKFTGTDRVGTDRHRRRQPRPPDHPGGPAEPRDGQAVVPQSRSQRGVMNTPSASTVMPSASEMCPAQNVLTPSVRVITASACSGPSGVARR